MTNYSQDFIDEHRDINVNHDWWDSTYDDFARICAMLGIELATYPVKLMNGKTRNDPDVSFSGFWSQGDGASWAGEYRPQGLGYAGLEKLSLYDTAPIKIREHVPHDEELHRIADELCLLCRIYGPVYASVRRRSSNYSHSNTMYVDYWEYYDEEIDPSDVASDITDHIEETLNQLFKDLADWLYNQLETEYEHLTSDEAVVESLEANEIEEDA